MKHYTALAALILSLTALFSCSGDGGRREPERPTATFTDNPNWTLTYTGREVDSSNGVYVVDPVYVRSTDNLSYYVDIVSLSEYNSAYGSSVSSFIQQSFKKMSTDYVVSGDSRNAFDALDAGNGDWVAVAYEITSDGSLGNRYSFLQFKTKAITMKQDGSFSISYDGRSKWVENGVQTDDDVDVISVKPSTDITYYVDIAYPEYINTNYDGDPVGFFNDVLDNIASSLSDNEDFSGYLYQGSTSVSFDRLRHGDWTAYAFGVDYLGNLTGSWSKLDFDIDEEEATDEFNKWIGTWRIGGNANGKGTSPVYYDISIGSSENNCYYTVENWETGEYADDFANQNAKDYIFETSFDRSSGNMIFESQYLGTLQDGENGTFDVYFLGNVEKGGETYADTGLPIATASLSSDGQSADVKGQDITVDIDGSFNTSFVSMQFIDIADEYLYIYNESVPVFPMTMEKLSGDSQTAASVTARKLPARKATATVHTKSAKGQSARRSAYSFENLRLTGSGTSAVTKSSGKNALQRPTGRNVEKAVHKNSFTKRK